MNNPAPGPGETAPSPKPLTVAENVEIPPLLGRYRLLSELASGGTALVYRAFDELLRREVAVKVTRPEFLTAPATLKLFMREARILASLDHPGILPIYDVGQTELGLCYLVCKLYRGDTLRTRLRKARLSVEEALQFVLQVAEALAHAHQHGLIHRDVKPENILLDAGNRAVLADFDLALKETQVGTGPTFVGTRPYMSPEQARREGHLVDARTDIFSLGVVLYEVLAGRRPFDATDPVELLRQIQEQEPLPLHRVDPAMPRSLGHICARALAKRPADRFASAEQFAEQLRRYLEDAHAYMPLGWRPPAPKLVFRSLRPFQVEDAAFFPSILPGPHTRDGIPECVHFWINRLECRDPSKAFRVGLLAGPCGSGKTSLVRAGVLPRLSKNVLALAVDASTTATETRILQALRQQLPALPPDLDLASALRLLRDDERLVGDRKVLLVLDRFEQWLCARAAVTSANLAEVLAECDGVQVQCLLVIREDFLRSASQLFTLLNVPLVEGENYRPMDVGGRLYARNLLRLMATACGVLPEDDAALSAEQEQVLDQAAQDLTVYGRLLPVNLAIFLEATRNAAWYPEMLRGPSGIFKLCLNLYQSYLDRTDRSTTFRAILEALLPPPDVLMKMHSVRRDHLLQIAGLDKQPDEFDAMLDYLDRDLRVITPIDPNQVARVSDPRRAQATESCEAHYQLTHEYMLPSLREWVHAVSVASGR